MYGLELARGRCCCQQRRACQRTRWVDGGHDGLWWLGRLSGTLWSFPRSRNKDECRVPFFWALGTTTTPKGGQGACMQRSSGAVAGGWPPRRRAGGQGRVTHLRTRNRQRSEPQRRLSLGAAPDNLFYRIRGPIVHRQGARCRPPAWLRGEGSEGVLIVLTGSNPARISPLFDLLRSAPGCASCEGVRWAPHASQSGRAQFQPKGAGISLRQRRASGPGGQGGRVTSTGGRTALAQVCASSRARSRSRPHSPRNSVPQMRRVLPLL